MRKTFVEPTIESVDIMPSDSVMTGFLAASGEPSVSRISDTTEVANPAQWMGINDGWF